MKLKIRDFLFNLFDVFVFVEIIIDQNGKLLWTEQTYCRAAGCKEFHQNGKRYIVKNVKTKQEWRVIIDIVTVEDTRP